MTDEERRVLDERIAVWLSEAEYDLGAAADNVSMARYKTAAVCAQQAAEKFLKALFIKRTGAAVVRTHEVSRLALELNASQGVVAACRYLRRSTWKRVTRTRVRSWGMASTTSRWRGRDWDKRQLLPSGCVISLETADKTVRDAHLARFIRDKVPILRDRFRPEHIIFFGSRARNEARGDSDIDMILVGKTFAAIKAPNRLGDVLNAIDSMGDVDALCFTPDEFEKYRRWPGIVKTACEEGIWL